jgi:hypothetical protein
MRFILLLLFIMVRSLSYAQGPDLDLSQRRGGEINQSNLIQFDLKKLTPKKEQEKPPFQGTLLTNLADIKKAYQIKNLDLVRASLEALLAQNKEGFELEGYLLLGAVYDQLHLYSKAIAIYDEGMAKTKQDQKLSFILNKSQVLRHWNKQKEASALLEKIDSEKYAKTYPQIFFYLGLSYLYLKDIDKSILNLRKYLENVSLKAPQAENVKRAIAWLILSKSSGGAGGGISNNAQDTEKALELLADQQMDNLMDSSQADVDDKSLNIESKNLEEGNEFSAIAD